MALTSFSKIELNSCFFFLYYCFCSLISNSNCSKIQMASSGCVNTATQCIQLESKVSFDIEYNCKFENFSDFLNLPIFVSQFCQFLDYSQ